MTATISLHPSFDPNGVTVIEHSDPACRFIAEGEECDGDEGRHAACRFCIGGTPYDNHPIVSIVVSDTERLEGNYRGDRRPQTDGPKLTREERMAKVAAWLVALGRKVETCDITHENARAARDYLRAYEGSFDFLVDLKAKLTRAPSDAQARGILNCWRADLLRGPAKPAPAPAAMPSIPADLAEFLP